MRAERTRMNGEIEVETKRGNERRREVVNERKDDICVSESV